MGGEKLKKGETYLHFLLWPLSEKYLLKEGEIYFKVGRPLKRDLVPVVPRTDTRVSAAPELSWTRLNTCGYLTPCSPYPRNNQRLL